MVKAVDPIKLARYREQILTNPETYIEQLKTVRENTRRRGELMFMELAMAEQDNYGDEDEEGVSATRDARLENVFKMVESIADQIDWLDKEIGRSVAEPNRKTRRSVDREQRKRVLRKLEEDDIDELTGDGSDSSEESE